MGRIVRQSADRPARSSPTARDTVSQAGRSGGPKLVTQCHKLAVTVSQGRCGSKVRDTVSQGWRGARSDRRAMPARPAGRRDSTKRKREEPAGAGPPVRGRRAAGSWLRPASEGVAFPRQIRCSFGGRKDSVRSSLYLSLRFPGWGAAAKIASRSVSLSGSVARARTAMGVPPLQETEM